MKFLLTILLGAITITTFAQSERTHIRGGNDAYKKGDLEQAEEEYRRAIEATPNSLKGTYNLGNVTYEQQRYEEAVKHYQSAAAAAKTDTDKSDALYNLGNAHLNQQELKEAVDAYKESLKLNPKDMASKYNLAYSLQQLKMQQQQQQEQQQQQGEQGEEGEEQEQEQQQNQEQQEQEQEEESPEDQEQQNQDEEDQENQSPPPTSGEEEQEDVDRQKALETLEKIGKEDEEVQKKMRKSDAQPSNSDKDW